MSTYYWIGNASNSVNTASNWSLYPLTGLTLPPAANSIPTDGDTIVFSWPTDSGASKPIYEPTGTLTGGLLFVQIDPNFELDIGSSTTALGLSADNILVSKKYQSSPVKGTETPSVYIHSDGPYTYLQTALWGDAPVPSAFSGSTFAAPQCVMNFSGEYRTVYFGDVAANDTTLTRSETLIFGDSVSTTIGGTDFGEEILVMSPTKNKSRFIFGSECTVITPTYYGTILLPITFVGAGTQVRLERGADLSSNCGGLHIFRSTDTSTPNTVIFERASYEGATGFNDLTRTTVWDLQMLYTTTPSKSDPRVVINHGVDIQGNLNITSGTFIINPCEEATRTYGSAARAYYVVAETAENTPKMELAPNCTIRELKITNPGGAIPPDILFDAAPLKTFFINQKVIEGYTGL